MQAGCLAKYAAERSKKNLILLKGAIEFLAIRSIFAFHAKGVQAVRSTQSRKELRKKGLNQIGLKKP